MKAYKGFDKELKCRGFQYEIGKTYTMPEGEDVKLCECGFHACEKPIDCFGYYAPGVSRYCEVELADVSDERSDDSKRVAKTITIIRELTLDDLHDITQVCAENGGDGSSLRGGDGSSLRGGNGSSLRGGNRSSLSGGDGSSLRGGNRSSLSGGYGSSLRGGNGSSLRGGNGSRFRGKKNTVFAAEWWRNNGFVGIRVAVVDGNDIKEDVWYVLDENGEWKAACNQQDI